MVSGEAIVANISRDELVELALAICNIDSAGPTEVSVAEYVYNWMLKEGFRARKVGLLRDRFNILGRLQGTGGGYSLLFNSHMDTAVRATDTWVYKDPRADIYHKAWIQGGSLYGEGIVNDKGPMAAFLIAAKAIKALGLPLKGDVLLTAVVGETSHEPCDDEPGSLLETMDLGTRFLITHGGVADYAIVAEITGYSLVYVECGMAWYKITWTSEQARFYTPFSPDRTTMRDSPNMIVRAAAGIEALERWAAEYQKRYSYDSPGGPLVPKVQIGAIRAGDPNKVSGTTQICSIYLGAFTVPGHDPLALKEEIQDFLRDNGVSASEVELYLFRRGYEAKNIERLKEALLRAHLDTFGTNPPSPNPATSSIWRDFNHFSELGIPAIAYGPPVNVYPTKGERSRSLTVDELYKTACVYARTIVDICNRPKPRNR